MNGVVVKEDIGKKLLESCGQGSEAEDITIDPSLIFSPTALDLKLTPLPGPMAWLRRRIYRTAWRLGISSRPLPTSVEFILDDKGNIGIKPGTDKDFIASGHTVRLKPRMDAGFKIEIRKEAIK